jgi:hypothetical protein
MNPKRLIPYLAVFLVLVGVYGALKWHSQHQETKEQQAKKVFQIQEKEISALTFLQDGKEIRLAKQDHDWQLTAPLKARADQSVVDDVLVALAKLQHERDLGPQKDLKPFGLDKPEKAVEFTAQGKSHRLALGGRAPGTLNYYARQDQEPNILLISSANKDSLDRTLPVLRDKTLLAFLPEEVKGLKIKSGQIRVDLEKAGTPAWRWVGRENFKVRSDRVDSWLRQLHGAKIREFLDQPPKELRSLGLGPASNEVTVVAGKGQETLLLGARKDDDSIYARKGGDGPVFLVNQSLAEGLGKLVSSLEDRRLWDGPVKAVRRVVWGPPGKSWTADQGEDSWSLKGPQDATLKQPGARLELALWNLEKLEYGAILPEPGSAPGQDAFTLEVFTGGQEPVFRLEELGAKGDQVEVKARQGGRTLTARVPAKEFFALKAELVRLTTPPPQLPAKKN